MFDPVTKVQGENENGGAKWGCSWIECSKGQLNPHHCQRENSSIHGQELKEKKRERSFAKGRGLRTLSATMGRMTKEICDQGLGLKRMAEFSTKGLMREEICNQGSSSQPGGQMREEIYSQRSSSQLAVGFSARGQMREKICCYGSSFWPRSDERLDPWPRLDERRSL